MRPPAMVLLQTVARPSLVFLVVCLVGIAASQSTDDESPDPTSVELASSGDLEQLNQDLNASEEPVPLEKRGFFRRIFRRRRRRRRGGRRVVQGGIRTSQSSNGSRRHGVKVKVTPNGRGGVNGEAEYTYRANNGGLLTATGGRTDGRNHLTLTYTRGFGKSNANVNSGRTINWRNWINRRRNTRYPLRRRRFRNIG